MQQEIQPRPLRGHGAFAFFERGAAAWADDPVPAAMLLYVGPASGAQAAAPIEGVRLVAAVPPERAAGHMRSMGRLDIAWLAAAETIEGELLADICAAVAERGGGLICETSLAALDRMTAAIPDHVPVHFLVDPDEADRRLALAAACPERRMSVCDSARDEAMDRIDRLQEEVARISRLLVDLAAQRTVLPGAMGTGFVPPPLSGAEEPATAVEAAVRAPARDFTAPPRSFVPEDWTIDRQRAKQVRHLLRQRRMREQYFPADMFADPAWDMLLDLYAARLERQPVSVSSLCIAAAVPATTALRWIKTMTEAGLFRREADPQDGRRIFIALADAALDAMDRYFEALDE
ncbi:MAG: winged helix DNA-binding protein [Sphingopyxis sp.]|uniref:winged helix DNA-binding protein n=1 Tax=Sphingopyxis sp. TaxID=1908224 RepID=UPI002ABB9AA9|nr:winged helix DNA-binding protein [Sphingopyxis sp.]MDZ3832351.1 winged helix DNA-binding protein [Sphingopyxis sp.]